MARIAIDSPDRKRAVRSDKGASRTTYPTNRRKTVQRNAIQIGERRGSLVILARDPLSSTRRLRFLIRCDCGREYTAGGTSFRVSLNCKACAKTGQPRKYGDRTVAETPLYRAWNAMKMRCRPSQKNWGARGIRVCGQWVNDFLAFETWALSHGYAPGLSIDRVNVDGNYEPGNCEWVTRSVNSQRCRAGYVMIRKEEYEELLILAGRKCPM